MLSKDDVEALAHAGLPTVTVAQLGSGDIDENGAALRIARACAGTGITLAPAFTGRVNLHAAAAGVALVNANCIDALNAIDESITVATVAPFARTRLRQIVATIKIIPFAAPTRSVEAVERLARGHQCVGVAPFMHKSLALVSTRFPHTGTSLLDKNRTALEARASALGSRVILERRVAHEIDAVATAIAEALAAGADPILVFGAGAIADRRDVVAAGIVRAGGTIEHFGMPVDPGNLLLIGRLKSAAVIGMPGCARSPKRNGFDMVLERLLAGLPMGRPEITAMGVGGLLNEIASRPQPRNLESSGAGAASRIGAIVLAAGLSSRMGRNKLLVRIGEEPLVRRVVRTLTASRADPVVVVTGNEAPAVKAALAGLPVVFAHNASFREGLSTSLRSGVQALPEACSGALVVLGDMPAISQDLVDGMIDAFNPAEGRAICVASHKGKRGNPVLWDRRFFPDLIAVTGDVGGKHLIAENEEFVFEVESADEGPLTDIDTPEELELWFASSK
ncbi:MAG TPA: molybdopterin-binding/glycosyltransferase family 2 protein [Rhizomicrobium sp.]